MSRTRSASRKQRFGIARTGAEWGIPRSTSYRNRRRRSQPALSSGSRRGPKTRYTDAALTTRILRLMRAANLLAPRRTVSPRGPRVHDGTITTDAPDRMRGTDATTTCTVRDGPATVFVAVDHANSETTGLHAARRADRFEALEPILQGVRRHFGTPEGNGVAERFLRTLKEQLRWVNDFDTIEDLDRALQEWLPLYNEHWLVQRHGHRSPAPVRRDLRALEAVA